ncbi:MAG: hypothetical protein HYS13_23060 [Planctomycetia bacterium]|nr:hypothetical protein [Planctomycetia bacterium]
MPLRVVFYKEDGDWVAHCLEFDLCGDGRTQQNALRNLLQAITIQVEESVRRRNPANLFSPADARYFQMFAQGADAAIGQLEWGRIGKFVEIQDVKVRVGSADENLVPA